MKILILLIILGLSGIALAYTAPSYDSVDLILNLSYTAPSYDSVDLVLGEQTVADTCTYTSGNWEVNCSDNCNIASPVDVGNNNISIIGVGTFKTSVNISNIGNLRIEGVDGSNICRVTCNNGGCFNL